MTEFSRAAAPTTLINTFTTTPAMQDRVAEFLVETAENQVSGLPGFIDATVHKSVDGTRVINYVRWESEGHWLAMLADPQTALHVAGITKLASADFQRYEAVATIGPRLDTTHN